METGMEMGMEMGMEKEKGVERGVWEWLAEVSPRRRLHATSGPTPIPQADQLVWARRVTSAVVEVAETWTTVQQCRHQNHQQYQHHHHQPHAVVACGQANQWHFLGGSRLRFLARHLQHWGSLLPRFRCLSSTTTCGATEVGVASAACHP